jgi:hypothetical protein
MLILLNFIISHLFIFSYLGNVKSIYFKAPFGLMEYNGMEQSGMTYNNVALFGFEI